MNKTIIALVFSVIFASFLVVPSIMAVIDDAYDISVLITSSEEEENHANDYELKSPSKETDNQVTYFAQNKLPSSLSDNYTSLFQDLKSPPPEFLF
tara:strand:- start:75973 stop:76260 length:288 start_codon:yes stop_codon:yes gene_type:complete